MRSCPYCGKRFRPTTSRKYYCSAGCSKAADYARRQKPEAKARKAESDRKRVRPKRDRRAWTKAYYSRPEIRERQNQWKRDNPERLAAYRTHDREVAHLKRVVYSKICRGCSEPFKTTRSKSLYCEQCAPISKHLERMKRHDEFLLAPPSSCARCGKLFKPRHRHGKTKKYCSLECSLESKKRRNRELTLELRAVRELTEPEAFAAGRYRNPNITETERIARRLRERNPDRRRKNNLRKNKKRQRYLKMLKSIKELGLV